MKNLWMLLAIAFVVSPFRHAAEAARLLVEAESFNSAGGWKLDTQFIEVMGSPYMLAHGIGTPVDDATTTVTFPEPGVYHVHVRTKDWVARWGAPGQPGRFKVRVNGEPLSETFGTRSAEWFWHPGGTVRVEDTRVDLALVDLTGFDGRVDALFFTTDPGDVPPNDNRILPAWRREALGLADEPTAAGGYDLVVVGGGYSGMGAAISAARQGLKVALIQNRPVLGGNGSSEVRVWAMGLIRRGPFPHVGEIVAEFADNATKSPGTYEEFEDAKKERIVRQEPNIDLFLNHHAYKVEMNGPEIGAVYAFDTRTSEHKRFSGAFYVDCTGHGTLGTLAGADRDMTPDGRMGMSNMWRWDELDRPAEFPETPWALDLEMADFPYPRDHHGQWFWESGFDKNPIAEAEAIRDWNFRAVYGAFNAMKNRDGAADHRNAVLTWVAYIGGPRESRRLMGDIVLTQEDIVTKRSFPDGCVPSTWSIDLHYPKKQYAKKFPDNPFIAIAEHDRRIDRNYGYPVPYRCFYSRNVPNLFMAGRCISVTHEALGTTRVMKTCGMMGEVVGKAAAICVQHGTTPRGVYESFWPEMETLLRLKGVMRRDSLDGEFYVPANAVVLKPPGVRFIDPAELPGLVIDDVDAVRDGAWTEGAGLKNYVGQHYLYGSPDSGASVRYVFAVPKSGLYEVRMSQQPHANRATSTPVTIRSAEGIATRKVNQQKAPDLPGGFISLGTFEFAAGQESAVTIGTENAGGTIHADAIQLLPAD